MLSLCTGAAFESSLGNREEKSGADRSQETCLDGEFRICSLRVGFLSFLRRKQGKKSCAGAQGLLALRFSRGSQDRLPQICGSFSF